MDFLKVLSAGVRVWGERWDGELDPPPTPLHISRKTDPIPIQLYTIAKLPIWNENE